MAVKSISRQIGDVIASMQGYRGSNKLKKIGQSIDWTPELLEEYIKCKEDPIYFGENYFKIIDQKGNFTPIQLFDYQKEIILSCMNNPSTIGELARQSGKTSAVTVFVCWYIIFNPNRTAAILANKEKTAMEILGRIKRAYEDLPDWLQQGVIEWNKGSIELENKSRVFAAATSNDNVRGFSLDFIFVDEAAHIEGWQEFWTSLAPTVSSKKHGRICLISTVNGLNHFYALTSGARKGTNNYNLISATWKDVPGRDEAWRIKALSDLNGDQERFDQEYCVTGETMVTVRNNETGKIEHITIEELFNECESL